MTSDGFYDNVPDPEKRDTSMLATWCILSVLLGIAIGVYLVHMNPDAMYYKLHLPFLSN